MLDGIPCDHGTVRPLVREGGDVPHLWTVSENILNKESGTAAWSYSLRGVRREANNLR